MTQVDIEKDKNEELVEEMAPVADESGVELSVLKEMAENGLMYGHRKTKTQPRFKKYIFMTRNGMEVIDLVKTYQTLEAAAGFLGSLVKENKTILVVATQPAAWEAAAAFASKFNFPIVKNKWIGGLLTNFKIVSLRIEHYKKLKDDMAKGALEKYTKKERVMFNKDIERMEKMFGGVESLAKMPEAILTFDTSLKGHMTAIKEAKIMKIPVVAVIDSDDNPELVNWPIVANDHSKKSIDWVVNKIIEKIQ